MNEYPNCQDREAVTRLWKLVSGGLTPDNYWWCITNVARAEWRDLQSVHSPIPAGNGYGTLQFIHKNLAGFLADPDRDAHQIARWIVSRWGGINRGVEAVDGWIEAINPEGVNDFINAQGTNRIASWSKLLSMHDSENYAVYDSRTSTALNCCLAVMGRDERFVMVNSRSNTPAYFAKIKLREEVRKEGCSYWYYLKLLRCFSQISGFSLLGVEAVIFENAPRICANYCNGVLTAPD